MTTDHKWDVAVRRCEALYLELLDILVSLDSEHQAVILQRFHNLPDLAKRASKGLGKFMDISAFIRGMFDGARGHVFGASSAPGNNPERPS
jgi:hypothetical protein